MPTDNYIRCASKTKIRFALCRLSQRIVQRMLSNKYLQLNKNYFINTLSSCAGYSRIIHGHLHVSKNFLVVLERTDYSEPHTLLCPRLHSITNTVYLTSSPALALPVLSTVFIQETSATSRS